MKILLQSKIKKIETESSPINTDGISMRPRKSGASAQTPQVQIFLLILLKLFNISMKLRTPWNLPSNGPPKKEL